MSVKSKGLRVFTHTDDGENWLRLYPFTIVGCQFGKRVYKEFSDPREVIERIENSEIHTTQWIITPNGKSYNRTEFVEAYEIAVGLIVP